MPSRGREVGLPIRQRSWPTLPFAGIFRRFCTRYISAWETDWGTGSVAYDPWPRKRQMCLLKKGTMLRYTRQGKTLWRDAGFSRYRVSKKQNSILLLHGRKTPVTMTGDFLH